MKTKFYVIAVEGGIEPGIQGPFKSNRVRNTAAKKFRNIDENNIAFWLDQTGQKLSIGPYSNTFMEE